MNFLTLFTILFLVSSQAFAASRTPTPRDHLLCRIEYKSEWEIVLQGLVLIIINSSNTIL
jgi:hypothetical protein